VTRFDAADPTERRKLVADAVRAHRRRSSPFLTVELDPEAVGAPADTSAPDGTESAPDGTGAPADDERPVPWIQFAEDTFNLDCTDAELDALEALLESFPEFRIDALDSPEGADGTNVRLTARSDANRLAAFVDRAFRAVYGAPEGYRLWVVAV
jgi:hypothetical protein